MTTLFDIGKDVENIIMEYLGTVIIFPFKSVEGQCIPMTLTKIDCSERFYGERYWKSEKIIRMEYKNGKHFYTDVWYGFLQEKYPRTPIGRAHV